MEYGNELVLATRNPYYAADRIGVLLRDIEPNHQPLSAVFSFLRLIFHPDQCRGEACVLERAWGMWSVSGLSVAEISRCNLSGSQAGWFARTRFERTT